MPRPNGRRSVRRTPSLALLLAVVAIAAVTAAPAGPPRVLDLWPDRFEPSVGPQWGFRSGSILTSLAAIGQADAPFSNVNFHAAVELRNGRTIQGVTYHHTGHGANALTVVSLLRMPMGGQAEVLASGSSTQNTLPLVPNDIVPVALTLTSSNLTIEPGYRYFVTVNVDNSDASVRGVRIHYR